MKKTFIVEYKNYPVQENFVTLDDAATWVELDMQKYLNVKRSNYQIIERSPDIIHPMFDSPSKEQRAAHDKLLQSINYEEFADRY